MHVVALGAKNSSSTKQSISQWEQIIQLYFERLHSVPWQWSYTGGWRTVLAWRWMNQSGETCRIKRSTCVMAVVIGRGRLTLLLGLAALVPGLCAGAPVGFGQQRGNGLPQRLGLRLGRSVALFLGLQRSFLVLAVFRQASSGRRILNKDLISSLGLPLWWMLSVHVKFLHLCLTTTLRKTRPEIKKKKKLYTKKEINWNRYNQSYHSNDVRDCLQSNITGTCASTEGHFGTQNSKNKVRLNGDRWWKTVFQLSKVSQQYYAAINMLGEFRQKQRVRYFQQGTVRVLLIWTKAYKGI